MNVIDVPKSKLVQITKKPVTKKSMERGCAYCPQNKVKGIKKIFNKVHPDRKIIIFTSHPGPAENSEGKILASSNGEFLFDELAKVGITRKDVDLQNSVRCYPADRREGALQKREARKEEIHCCSIYNDEVKKKTQAKIYILLGAVTHKAVLGREYKKSKKVFWSPVLKAKIYCLAHPGYFLGGHAPQLALTEFRDALKAIATDVNSEGKLSQYAYLEKKDYKAVTTPQGVKELYHFLKDKARKQIRISSDIEYDIIDNKKLFLCNGYSWKPGHARIIILDHPQARKIGNKWLPLDRKIRRRLHHLNAKIQNDPLIKKAFHQGSTDVPFIEEYEDIVVRGYDYDTIYADFLANPDRRAYGLANIALQKYPQFGDYKTIILPECIPPGTDLSRQKGLPKDHDLDTLFKFVAKNHLMHFSYLPLKKLVLRNGADCDITKRLELATKNKISLPLLRVYRDAAFILAKMEPNGPEFDFKHAKKLKQIYPPRFETVKNKLRLISGRKDFNPGAHQQIKDLLYIKLKIKPPDIAYDSKKKRKRNADGELEAIKPKTDKAVLEVLGRKYKVVRLIQEYRRLGKIISTYINAFESNAKQNGGRLKTKWWLTGTKTGRLSSGGDKQVKEAKNENINLQNIHGDPAIQNLAVADKNWRKLYKAIHKAVASLYGKSLSEVADLVQRITTTKDKDKKKALNEKLDSASNALKMRLYNSNKWQKIVKEIIRVYGNVELLLGFDQGQIEVRVMAQASGDKNLIRDCMSGDIHSKVGHEMTGWPIKMIAKDKKTRTLTKNIHFGILFGLGPEGLMAFIKLKDPDSTITEEEALRLYNNYFKAYPKVRDFITAMREFVEEHGYVENMFGFKRPLKSEAKLEGYENDEDENDDEDRTTGAYWGNQAINTPIQGAAHMLMLMGLATLRRKYQKYKSLGIPTIEVHDYLGSKIKLKNIISSFYLYKQLLEKEPLNVVKKYFKKIKWKIPLVVEGKVGFRYGDSIECEEDGKLKKMHEILADMFLETFVKEVKINKELELARAS